MDGIAPDGGALEGDNLAREARVRSAYLNWCKEYKKEPDETRFQQFSINFLDMEEFAKESGQEMSLNEYADCTEEEYNALLEGEAAIKEAESAIQAADEEMSSKAKAAEAEAAAKKAAEEAEAKKKAEIEAKKKAEQEAAAAAVKKAEEEAKKKKEEEAKKKKAAEEEKRKLLAEKGTNDGRGNDPSSLEFFSNFSFTQCSLASICSSPCFFVGRRTSKGNRTAKECSTSRSRQGT